MPAIRRMLETALYVADLDRAGRFFSEVLGLTPMFRDERLLALDAGGGTVLLLFLNGGSVHGATLPQGRIPAHDGIGPVHFAFAIEADELPAWETHLSAHGVLIESRVRWDRGGTSLYFRDPNGHSVELATPGIWPTY